VEELAWLYAGNCQVGPLSVVGHPVRYLTQAGSKIFTPIHMAFVAESENHAKFQSA